MILNLDSVIDFLLSKLKNKILIFILASSLAFSCKKENAGDCFKSNGSERTILREVSDFTFIKVFDKIDLNVSQGDVYKVEIVGGKNLLTNISTENVNGILTIKNNNKCNFVRGYKRKITVNVTLPRLDKVENDGVGTITLDDNFVQDSIFIRAENSGDIYINGAFKRITSSSHGNGDVYMSGTCERLNVYMLGTNFFRGEKLTIKNYVFLETISIGDCYINAPANGVLECNIHRAGSIYYKGEPAVINNYSDGTAKGQLIKE